MNEVSSQPSTTSAWIWAIISAVYALSPIDIIPDFIPVIGWADDLLAIVGGGLNLLQATVAQTNDTLAGILKFVKWAVIILGIILIGIVALIGGLAYSLFK